MESRRGATSSRSANFPPATAGPSRAREGRGILGGAAPPDGASGRSTYGSLVGTGGVGYTRSCCRGSRRDDIAHLEGPYQPRGSEARGILALLAGWARASQGVARVSLGLLEARVLGTSTAPRGPSPGGRRCLAGHWAWTRGKSKGGLRGPGASREGPGTGKR